MSNQLLQKLTDLVATSFTHPRQYEEEEDLTTTTTTDAVSYNNSRGSFPKKCQTIVTRLERLYEHDHGQQAAAWSQDNLVEFVLLCQKENSDIINATTEGGWTPLHMACMNESGYRNHLNVINQFRTKGLTGLHVVSFNGGVKTVERLLQYGANVHATEVWQGITPLDIAATRGHYGIAKLLLAYGADSNATRWNGWTPLHCAIQSHADPKVIRLLLQEGKADPNKKIIPDDDCCFSLLNMDDAPLHLAIGSDNIAAVKILLEFKADVNAITCYDMTPLHCATAHDRIAIAKLLLDHGADMTTSGEKGTPLHVACRKGNLKAAKLLLDYKADPNARDFKGRTPLHLVRGGDNGVLAMLLLDHNANAYVTDYKGRTPLHTACKDNQVNAVELLLASNCYDPKDRHAELFNLATGNGFLEIAELLYRRGARLDHPRANCVKEIAIPGNKEVKIAERIWMRNPPLRGNLSLSTHTVCWDEPVSHLFRHLTKHLDSLHICWDSEGEETFIIGCLRSLIQNNSVRNILVTLGDNLASAATALLELLQYNHGIQHIMLVQKAVVLDDESDDGSLDDGSIDRMMLVPEESCFEDCDSMGLYEMQRMCLHSTPRTLSVEWGSLWLAPLAKYLREPTCSLAEISLSEPKDSRPDRSIVNSGLADLCNALTVNTSVLRLDLHKIKGAGRTAMNALATNLCKMRTLTHFQMWKEHYDFGHEEQEYREGMEVTTQDDIDSICFRNRSLPLITSGKEALWPHMLESLYLGLGSHETRWGWTAAYELVSEMASLTGSTRSIGRGHSPKRMRADG